MAELREFRCHADTIGTIGERSLSGDHILVRLKIQKP